MASLIMQLSNLIIPPLLLIILLILNINIILLLFHIFLQKLLLSHHITPQLLIWINQLKFIFLCLIPPRIIHLPILLTRLHLVIINQ